VVILQEAKNYSQHEEISASGLWKQSVPGRKVFLGAKCADVQSVLRSKVC
jgi:hypothetical protein